MLGLTRMHELHGTWLGLYTNEKSYTRIDTDLPPASMQ